MYPRQSPTTHTEQLGDEASVYDWARAQVHALNPTAARVWRQCDGATSPAAIAAACARRSGIPEADAVVDLTLTQLARLHLLELPAETRGDRPATTRRWLLGRGVAAAMLPAIYSIVAPSPVEAQSPAPGAPTLTSVAPNQGIQGTTVAVTLTGTNFVVGATTVNVSGSGVTVTNVTVGSSTSLSRQLRRSRSDGRSRGPRTVTVTTAGGTSGGQTFTINLPTPGAPTLTSVAPNQGIRGTTVAVTLTGTNFIVGATTVTVAGGGVTVTNVVVGSATSLTANFVLDPAAADGPRTVTVTTAGGTSGAQIFTITLPAPGAPTLTSVSPNQGTPGHHGGGHADRHQFRRRRHDGERRRWRRDGHQRRRGQRDVADRQLRARSGRAAGPRTVTVTTAGGTSGAQAFTITLPPPGSATFNYTGGRRPLRCPPASSASRLWPPARRGGAGFPARHAGAVAWAVGRRRPCRHAGRVAHRARRWPVSGRLDHAAAASTAAAAAPETAAAAAGAHRACVMATPRS